MEWLYGIAGLGILLVMGVLRSDNKHHRNNRAIVSGGYRPSKRFHYPKGDK